MIMFKKSINGFNRQIGELLGSKYTDGDLESAKRILKASLLQKEGVWAKLDSINRSLKYSEDFDKQIFNEIDKITREDIDNFAKKFLQILLFILSLQAKTPLMLIRIFGYISSLNRFICSAFSL